MAMINEISSLKQIEELLKGDEELLTYTCRGIDKKRLHRPGPDFIERVWMSSDRNPRVLGALQRLYDTGNLKGTGYLSILPVDQGVEHAAGASFAINPDYFDPENIIQLAIEGGCNAVATTYGAMGILARKYAHRIPFILKLNHNELLSYPNTHDQVFFTQVESAYQMGAQGVGATVYFGSPESRRQIQEVSEAFSVARELGMFTVLWCYLRNPEFKQAKTDYHLAADLSSQANHLGATLGADIVKQKMPENNGGYNALKFGKTHEKVYSELCPDHPIEWVRFQVANSYFGRVGLINSGGAAGKDDLRDIVKTAVINKRAGGMGLISGRKIFQRPRAEGVKLLKAMQTVYLAKEIDLA
jgi:class I fructose-bisphosphate aldolase